MTSFKADIAFLIDSSRSVSEEDFDKQKAYVKNITGHFQFGPLDTRVGVIKYGSTADLEIDFDSYQTLDDFNQAVDGIPYARTDGSRLDLAVDEARTSLFNLFNDRGSGVVKVTCFV